jgi:hypothetical protein
MKRAWLAFAMGFSVCKQAQQTKKVFIITIDGLRWQKVFLGANSMLLKDERFVTDTSLLSERHNDRTPELRRQKQFLRKNKSVF